VTCLIQFQIEHAREDTLRPLLPWLGDGTWCDLGPSDRLRLIQSNRSGYEPLNLGVQSPKGDPTM
jgi:hypothetical protein